MQSVSAGFTTASQSNIQAPLSYLEISWDNTGLFSGARAAAGWTNETAALVSSSGSLTIIPPGEALVSSGSTSRLTVILNNTAQRYSWQRSDKPLYANIGNAGGLSGIKIRLWQGYTVSASPEYVCIFAGFIADWREQTSAGQVTLDCFDRGWRWLQDKRSLPVYEHLRADEWIVQLCTEIGLGAGNRNLDTGLYQIPYCWLDDESVIEEMRSVAASEGGLVYFDQPGILQFQNALNWAARASVWTFDEGEYQLSDPTMNSDALATEIISEWSGRYEGPQGEIYTLDSYKWIQPGTAEVWTARFRQAAIEVFQPDSEDPYTDFTAISTGGALMNDDVTIVASGIFGQQCTITATNTNTTWAAQLQHLTLRGRPLLGGPAEQEKITVSPSPLTDHERTRSVRGNPYVQTATQARAVGNALADRLKRIRPTWQLSGIAGVPQLELTDVITFKDDRQLGSGNSVDAIVIGLDWTCSGNGYLQTVRAYDVTDLLAYDNYFIIGTTALGGAGGRAFH